MTALGFHFSKWDKDLKVDKVIDKDELFEGREFPVDYYWMDIGHTKQNRYFMFNPETFPLDKVTKLNLQIKERERRLVVITDPHVQKSAQNPVWWKANKAFFVKDCEADVFVGKCWPGASVYVDFLNEEAC